MVNLYSFLNTKPKRSGNVVNYSHNLCVYSRGWAIKYRFITNVCMQIDVHINTGIFSVMATLNANGRLTLQTDVTLICIVSCFHCRCNLLMQWHCIVTVYTIKATCVNLCANKFGQYTTNIVVQHFVIFLYSWMYIASIIIWSQKSDNWINRSEFRLHKKVTVIHRYITEVQLHCA